MPEGTLPEGFGLLQEPSVGQCFCQEIGSWRCAGDGGRELDRMIASCWRQRFGIGYKGGAL